MQQPKAEQNTHRHVSCIMVGTVSHSRFLTFWVIRRRHEARRASSTGGRRFGSRSVVSWMHGFLPNEYELDMEGVRRYEAGIRCSWRPRPGPISTDSWR